MNIVKIGMVCDNRARARQDAVIEYLFDHPFVLMMMQNTLCEKSGVILKCSSCLSSTQLLLSGVALIEAAFGSELHLEWSISTIRDPEDSPSDSAQLSCLAEPTIKPLHSECDNVWVAVEIQPDNKCYSFTDVLTGYRDGSSLICHLTISMNPQANAKFDIITTS